METNAIVSDEYMDLLLEYYDNSAILKQYENLPITKINNNFVIIHIPVQELDKYQYRYAEIPSLFGLVSDFSQEASGIPKIRNFPKFNLKGQGVLIGIIDTGVDYTNPVFQYADHTTRIVSIWDQTIESSSSILPRYGTSYSRDQINQALRSSEPFLVVPSKDTIGHGTMIAGISGGSEIEESNFSGVAPEVEFIVVKLKQAKKVIRNYFFIPEGAACYQETDILFGIEYALDMAAFLKKPIVLCIGVNSSQGAHDGRDKSSNYLSTVSTIGGVGTVVAAGNEGNSRRHYYGTINPSIGYNTVELIVGKEETGFSMEIWGKSPSLLTIEIQSPFGEYIPKIAVTREENTIVSFLFDQTTINIRNEIVETESGDQLILMRFDKPSPGIWKFKVYETGDLSLDFNMWLPMEGFISNDTYFLSSDPYTTILALGNAQVPITVTAYNPIDNNLYLNSSRGYTRIGLVKPIVAAPGVDILGPDLMHGFSLFTGTSISTAHASGIVAMILEWGVVKGNLEAISTVEINKLIIRGARRELSLSYPNRDWGYGILDIYNIFSSLRSNIVI